MACLFNIQDSLDPRHHLMGAGIGRLIKIDDTVFKIVLKRSFEGSRSSRDGSVVVGEYIHLVIVFQQQRPILGLDAGRLIRRLNNELLFNDLLLNLEILFLQFFFILRHRLLIGYI